MQISVVIPVYKAEAFLQEAVSSVLIQPETGEVLLIEDNSPDGSIDVCRRLVESDARVRLLRHPNGENRGAGASRNLGIRSARHEFVAFLDADDFYLPGRFEIPRQLFASRARINGVYEAVGVHYQNADARHRWLSEGLSELTTLSEKVNPEALFDALVGGGKGHLHLDGLLVKKEIFDSSGLFHENLRLHQDTAMMIQLAETGLLIPGRIETPVAMRRVHAGNRFSVRAKDRAATAVQMSRTMLWWAIRKGCDQRKINALAYWYWYLSAKLLLHPLTAPAEWLKNLVAPLYLIARHPMIAGKSLFEFRVRYTMQRKNRRLETA
jgi:glycosyltransferase involved in cell wall biosynthesis